MHRRHQRPRHKAASWLPLFVATLLVCTTLGATAPAQSLENNPLLLDSPKSPVPSLDFEGETLSGKSVRLSELRGRVVVLNFWATWCVPCLLEMPAMHRLNRKLAKRPFTLLAINQAESREQVEKFAREYNFSFQLVLDPIGEIGTNYSVNRLPMTYIIDRDGFVVRRAVGPREWDNDAALHLFEQLMSDDASAPTVTPAAQPGG